MYKKELSFLNTIYDNLNKYSHCQSSLISNNGKLHFSFVNMKTWNVEFMLDSNFTYYKVCEYWNKIPVVNLITELFDIG